MAFAVALLPGCGREEIRTYRIPKAEVSGPAVGHHPGDGHNHEPEGQQALPVLKWKTPAGWEEVEPGQMRAASFRVKGEGKSSADVGVFPLPGMAGSDLDNVNRWRGQVGLEPVKEEELAGIAEQVRVAGGQGQLYDLAGVNAAEGEKIRIIAAILRREGIAWFFKMTGDDSLVASQKQSFKALLESMSFTTPDETGLPPSHPPIGGMAAASGIGSEGLQTADPGGAEAKPAWKVPTGWEEVAAGQFLVAKFQLKGGDDAAASVNVSVSGGAGGGVAGNVNRWRTQLGLEVVPAEKLDLTKLETPAGEVTLVDMRGTDARTSRKSRLIGAVVPQEGKTWFYKLMGDEAIVEREKDAFITFLKTTRY